jgi:hypothetical protein
MWQSRTKADLIIEAWEKLDCESVGSKELIAIEKAVRERFGPAAVDSPMIVARMLADEGAELRHSEIMDLYLTRQAEGPYHRVFRNILKFGDLKNALTTIRNLENIRRKFESEDDKEGLRLLREVALSGKKELSGSTNGRKGSPHEKEAKAEMLNWLTLWLQSPEVFENWLSLRIRSKDFVERFGEDLTA